MRNPSIPFAKVAWIILLAALVVNLAAAVELRGLYADGVGYLFYMIENGGFKLIEPSRLSVQILQQWPTVMGMASGIHDAAKLSVIHCVSLQLLPLALVTTCYLVLPKDRKNWFFFPLLHYLAGSMGAAFPSIVEGPVATAYFWLVFYSILFRTETGSSLALVTLLALPLAYSHEVMIFLAPILALAAVWRASMVESKWQRNILWLLALWFFVVVAIQIGFVLIPRDTGNRGYFIDDFIGLNWLIYYEDINVPVALGILAILSLLVIWLMQLIGRESTWVKVCSLLVTVAFGLVCLLAITETLHSNRFFHPWMQFAARNHPASVSALLALLALASLRRPRLQNVWATTTNEIILLFLAVGVLGWHVVATSFWTDYLASYRDVLSGHQGLVSYEAVVLSLPQKQHDRFEKMTWGWTNPLLSLLLSPKGKVSTMIANPSTLVGWQPFDPADLDALPKNDWFDTSQYQRLLKQAKSEGNVNPK
jgi:hypothetical protein